MRSLVIAFLAALPVAALAQTPADIARQVWPGGAPAAAGGAPADDVAGGGAATGRDLARLLSSAGAPTMSDVAPPAGSVYAQAFTGADVARLRSSPVVAAPAPAEPGIAVVSVAGAR